MANRTKKKNEDEQAERRMVILDPQKCKPTMPAWTYFLRNQRQCGKECITVINTAAEKKIIVWDNACAACLNRAKRCPDNAAKVVKLPSNLTTDVTHKYGPNSFKLHGLPMPRRGEVLGILGSNGTGKSTALKILSGKMKPNLGNYDQPPSWSDITKYYRGSDLQNYFKAVLEDKLTVSMKPQMDADFAKQLAGRKVEDLIDKNDERKIKDEILKQMDLVHLTDRDVGELSGGELQRVAITLAIMKDVDVYMFDEPSSFLDVRQRLQATKVIRDLVTCEGANQSKYVIVVEHDLAVLDYMSDFIHCLYGEPGAYGVVCKRANLRNGINNFLAGFIPAENMKFRDEALSFKISQISAAEARELGLAGGDPSKRMGEQSYPAMTKVLSSDNEKKKFTLHVEAGGFSDAEVIGLMGENGTGKTTYLQMLAGLYDKETTPQGATEKTFDCEQISLLGMGVTMAYKRQDYAPKFRRYNKTVQELLERNCQAAWSDSLFKLLVMKPLHIEEMMDLTVSTLSGGELQRLAITVCLGTPAGVYLIDEPSAGLDCEQRAICAKVIKRWIVSHLGRTCFVIEHDTLMMSALADKMILFSGSPGVETTAHAPCSVGEGFNRFLEILEVTFRRDPTNHRPRINKQNSTKDREQKAAGQFYKLDVDEEDDD